jgi:hypothetical protein
MYAQYSISGFRPTQGLLRRGQRIGGNIDPPSIVAPGRLSPSRRSYRAGSG